MNLLQVSSNDLVGRRFNGFDLHERLAARGVAMRYLAWTQRAADDFAAPFFPVPGSRLLHKLIVRKLEKMTSRQAQFAVQSFALPWHGAFRRADVVHYHVIYDGFFSLAALPRLARLKPSVWSWHDPWPMTGHCIHPMACGRWHTGCGSCPQLDAPFAMRRDRTAEQFRWKRDLYARLDIDVVVGSAWMLDFARRSPLAQLLRIHHIPLGIDLAAFKPRDAAAARARLGVEPGVGVVAFRAAPGPLKGLPDLVAALHRLGTERRLALVAFDKPGLLAELAGMHQVIDLGWADGETVHDAYAASDLFVMPSRADSFGLMAVEAMASGRPVICTEGTAVPATVFAPDVGIAAPRDDVAALAAAIAQLLDDPAERAARGARGRAAAVEHYDIERQASSLAALYAEAAARRTRAVVGW